MLIINIFIIGISSCLVPNQIRVRYDVKEDILQLCNDRHINRIEIFEYSESNNQNKICTIEAIDTTFDKVSLFSETIGYNREGLCTKMPNEKYKIYISYYDTNVFIYLITDSVGNISKVINEFSCE